MSAIPTSPSAGARQTAGPIVVPALPPRSHSWITILIVLAVVAGVVAGYRALTKPARPKPGAAAAVRTAKAMVAPLDVTLRVSGQTVTRNYAQVNAPLLRGFESGSALILLQLAPAGAMVKKGQLVARLDAQSLQDHIDDMKDTVAQAENDILKRKAEQKVEWETMQQTLRVTKGSLEKAKYDYSAAEVKVDVERELLKLAVDQAEAQYKQQQKDVATRKASQEAEIRVLELTLERHKRHMNRHAHDFQKYTMLAPMDGLVVMATVFRGGEMGQVQQGDQIWPGQQIMKVVDTRNMLVEGSVGQSDSGDLRLTQQARVGLDAFPDLHFNGKVYSIGALAVGGWRQNFFIRAVPVRIQIEGRDPRLIPDLSAHANIVLETLPNQLQIPAGAVEEENGKALVSVKFGDRFERREVKLGKRNNLNVAILAGLKAGDEVRVL